MIKKKSFSSSESKFICRVLKFLCNVSKLKYRSQELHSSILHTNVNQLLVSRNSSHFHPSCLLYTSHFCACCPEHAKWLYWNRCHHFWPQRPFALTRGQLECKYHFYSLIASFGLFISGSTMPINGSSCVSAHPTPAACKPSKLSPALVNWAGNALHNY